MTGQVCGYPTLSGGGCRRTGRWLMVGQGDARFCWQHALFHARKWGIERVRPVDRWAPVVVASLPFRPPRFTGALPVGELAISYELDRTFDVDQFWARPVRAIVSDLRRYWHASEFSGGLLEPLASSLRAAHARFRDRSDGPRDSLGRRLGQAAR